jgi:hypothetical protein
MEERIVLKKALIRLILISFTEIPIPIRDQRRTETGHDIGITDDKI